MLKCLPVALYTKLHFLPDRSYFLIKSEFTRKFKYLTHAGDKESIPIRDDLFVAGPGQTMSLNCYH